MTMSDVLEAQHAWVNAIVTKNIDMLLGLYDFGSKDEPLLFKPTMTNVIRMDEEGTRSYFEGNNPNYPHDDGFLNHDWKHVDFQSAAGPILKAGGLDYRDMGQYSFINHIGDTLNADYTFAYHKLNGKVLISLHHSSLTWIPPSL